MTTNSAFRSFETTVETALTRVQQSFDEQRPLEETSQIAHTPPSPRNCGRRLLTHVIDERAGKRHTRPFASIPKTNEVQNGYRDISYGRFANAINRLAHWLVEHLGKPAFEDETIVYLAPGDLRYQILCMAAPKAGYITFLPSPRNSDEAFASLLNECNASKLVTDSKPYPGVSTMLKCRDMTKFIIPSLDELLNRDPVPDCPFPGTWEEYRFRPFVQIHSSGSTGLPKLVTLKHGTFTAWDAYQTFRPNEMAMRLGSMRLCVSFPSFHMAGVIYGLEAPCWVDSTVILPPAKPLTAEIINATHVKAGAEYSLLTPSLVVDLAKKEEWLGNLSKLKGLTFAGGPLPEATGQLIAQKTILSCGYGAAEAMAVPLLPKSPEDWAYFRFNENDGAMDFRERDAGLYELVIRRKAEVSLAQPVFVTYPDLDEFYSKDLFTPHPEKPGLWKYVSRLDDIIVFSNGEKLNPVACENLITTSPDVKGCVVVGSGQFQPALLVEPVEARVDDVQGDSRSAVTRIWPLVQQANELNPRHGRIAQHLIIFTKPDKPLPRAGKGTIQRAAANKLYASEIKALFDSAPDSNLTETGSAETIKLQSPDETMESLAAFFRCELGIKHFTPEDDFFDLGMDSLQLINVVRAINLGRPDHPIEAKFVYDNPSLKQLVYALHGGEVEKAHPYIDDSDNEDIHESWLAMDRTYNEFVAEFGGTEKRGLRKLGRSDHNGPVIPPEGGWDAWRQILAMFLINMNNWGLVNSFGVFEAFYRSTVLTNYSASQISWIGTIQGALLLIVGVVSGPLFDSGFFRHVLVIGSIGLVFALMMLSISTQYYQIMLTQGMLLGICEGLLYIPSVALVPVYFKHRRGIALGIVTGGGPVGGIIFPAILSSLLRHTSFGWAVRTIGFVPLVTLSLAVVLSKPLGRRTTRELFDKAAFTDLPYVVFMLHAFLLFTGMFVPYWLASAYSIQDLKTSASLSLSLPSILNAGQLFGRVLFAWLSDFKLGWAGAELYMLVAEVLLGLLAFCWIGVSNNAGFIVWLVVYGIVSGLPLTLPALVLPHICPNMAVYGTRLGMLYACAGLGLLISTPIATAANGGTKTFLGSQLWTGATCMFAGALFVFVALMARKRRILYEVGKHKASTLSRSTRNTVKG